MEVKTLTEVEKAEIINALRAFKTASEAAKALGISRPGLYRRMKKHSIDRSALNVGS